MIKIDRHIPPPGGLYESPEKKKINARKRFIEEVLTILEVGDSTVIETNNINAWRVSFTGFKRRNKIVKQFTIAPEFDLDNNNKYRIWRVK